MTSLTPKLGLFAYLALNALCVFAEGIIDVKPFVQPSVYYDDNIFRFSSSRDAQATFGSSATSDVVKRLDLGVNVNVRLARQLITLNSSFNESWYDRFDFLDNTGNSNQLNWNWRLGNNVFGDLAVGRNEAIAGFNEFRAPLKNLRTTDRQTASINWNFHPDWIVSFNKQWIQTDNELAQFSFLNREDDVFETGIRYQNQIGTQFGLAYRKNDSSFLNRTGFVLALFGKEATLKEVISTIAWAPFDHTRVSTRIAHVELERENVQGRDFEGISQIWNVDYAWSSKTALNISAYQEVNQIDDILSSFVKTKGLRISPSWNPTTKLLLRAGVGYEDRDYLGSATNINLSDRNDRSTTANLSLSYTPTTKSLVQLQYQTEDRKSDAIVAPFKFNSLNLSFRYDF